MNKDNLKLTNVQMFRELTEVELFTVGKILLDLQDSEDKYIDLDNGYDDAMSDLALATDELVNMRNQLQYIKLDNGKFKAMNGKEVLQTCDNLTRINRQQERVNWLSKRFDEAILQLAYYENKLYDMRKHLDDKLKEVQA